MENDDDNDDQTLEKISVDFTNGYSCSIITHYLGAVAWKIIWNKWKFEIKSKILKKQKYQLRGQILCNLVSYGESVTYIVGSRGASQLGGIF